MGWVAAARGLGIHEPTIGDYLEPAAAGRDHLDVDALESLPESCRQTDGFGLVVSGGAVFDGYAHGVPPWCLVMSRTGLAKATAPAPSAGRRPAVQGPVRRLRVDGKDGNAIRVEVGEAGAPQSPSHDPAVPHLSSPCSRQLPAVSPLPSVDPLDGRATGSAEGRKLPGPLDRWYWKCQNSFHDNYHRQGGTLGCAQGGSRGEPATPRNARTIPRPGRPRGDRAGTAGRVA